jgi:hypothetical protein
MAAAPEPEPQEPEAPTQETAEPVDEPESTTESIPTDETAPATAEES